MRHFLLPIFASASVASLALTSALADTPGHHPAYLHALTDLRDARAHLQHLGSDPMDHAEERAVGNIDKALDEIKRAAIEDGKNIEDHMPVDAHVARRDRFRKAMELLDKAKQDVSAEEDQPDTKGLQMRVINRINAARHDVNAAVESSHDR